MDSLELHYGSEKLRRLIDLADGTHAEQVIARPPTALLTDNAGPYARMRVDVGQTGFWAGREGRFVRELTILTGSTYVLKFVCPVNFIIYDTTLELTLSQVKAYLKSGGVAGGTFSDAVQSFKTNLMSTASDYALQAVVTGGGTHTGGTTYDILEVVSGSNVNKAIVQSTGEDTPLGFPAGTYYIVLQNTDGATANGTFKMRWEERP